MFGTAPRHTDRKERISTFETPLRGCEKSDQLRIVCIYSKPEEGKGGVLTVILRNLFVRLPVGHDDRDRLQG